ncbi:MAG: NAD(P)-dependent oxidoreductase [Deltaproteobacteria bacterium]|nr:NAD(P)-dependent oxidoreductase [Deltaproteobacteria bacterium]
MKTLVTGAPGWLGTRLVEILRARERAVRCLVLPSTDRTHLEKLGAEVVLGDLSRPGSIAGIGDGVDTVFHLAGVIHPRRTRAFYNINVRGTENLLTEAVRSGADRFLLVSSNSAAGTNHSKHRMMRESDPPRPYKHYGRSKHRTEDLVNRAYAEEKIKTTIIRPCWYYGTRQPARQTTFFKMIKTGSPIIFGDGSNLRSLSYLDNIVDALLLAEEKEIAIGKTYWIADRRPYSVLEIYQTIARLLDVAELRPRFLPSLTSTVCELADSLIQHRGFYIKELHVAGEMTKNITCSIDKAKKELSYEPRIALEEGMRRSIEWCRANGVNL